MPRPWISGLSLGISTKKGGKVSGFIISLAIIFVYYTTITTFQNLVVKKIVSPFLGMWAPNIFPPPVRDNFLLLQFERKISELGENYSLPSGS